MLNSQIIDIIKPIIKNKLSENEINDLINTIASLLEDECCAGDGECRHNHP